MRHLIASVGIALVTVMSHAAETEKETKKPAFVQPIAEMKLTNGTVFRNVTVVRYTRETVVLKSSAGLGPLAYTLIPEPLRSQMIAERAVVLAAKSAADKGSAVANAKKEAAARELDAANAELRAKRAERVEKAMRDQTLIVGMTSDEAIRSWGSPDSKNTSGGTHGSTEQWVYRKGKMGTTYVYFTDGLLTSWQVSERR